MPAGRPPNDVVAYDERITVRLHSDEKVKLEDDAHVAGLSVGELVRRQYFNRSIIETEKCPAFACPATA